MNAQLTRLYIVKQNPADYKGYPFSTISGQDEKPVNDRYVDYSDGKTFAQYNETHGGDLVAIEWEEMELKYHGPHLKSLQKPFREITKERYWDMLECLPPVRWTRSPAREFFFISEAFTDNLHSVFVRIGKKYYEALRPINTDAGEIFNLT